MVYIRPETAVDISVIYELNCLAFDQMDEARLVDKLRNTTDFVSSISLVAVKNNEIVGHILFSPIRVEREGYSIPALALTPLAVKPGYQSKKIESELIIAELSRAKTLGYAIVVVVGHPNYYSKFGFKLARAHDMEVPFHVPDEAVMVMELEKGALDDVSGMAQYPLPFYIVE